MAGFVPVAHGVKVEILQLLSTIPVVNVMHARFAGAGGTAADLDAFAGDLHTTWKNHVLPQQNVDLTLEQVIVTDLTSIFAPQGSYSHSDPGGDSGDVLSANAALCISLKEDVRYRGGHGRLYIGGISQDRLDTPRTWTSTTITDFNNGFVDFLNGFNALTRGSYGLLTASILHARMATTHPVPTPPVYEPPFLSSITGINIDARVDSQRRRLGR